MSRQKRVTIAFRGGPLDGMVLDSQSSNGPERGDVTWLLAKTSGGKLGSSFQELDGLRSQAGRAAANGYELVSRGENTLERQLEFVFRVKDAEQRNEG